jgi:hypothetical protein
MRLPRLTVGLALGITCTAVLVAHAAAKDGSYIDGVTLSGGSLDRPITVSFALPEGYDDMSDAPPSPAQVAGTMSSWYDITLHVDFSETGHGRRTWQGRFDGVDYLYFPEAMLVGPGTWASGWYRANPLFAAELHRALAPSPPAAGSGSARTERSGQAATTSGLLLSALGLASFVMIRRRA